MASARACLEHLTRALAQLGVTTQSTAPPIPLHVGDDSSKDPPFLTAETLRRAKFNHPAACAPLWRALHDLSLVGCAGFPDPDVARRALASAREASARSAMQYAEAQLASGDGATNAGDARSKRAVAAELARTAEDETCARVARWHLRRHGYPHVDELETCEARGGDSRPLLLALAWTVRPHRQTKSSPQPPRPAPPPDLPIPPHTQPPPRHRSSQVQRDDVFARAHADAHAPSFIDASPGGDSSDLDASLPPFPADSACGVAASTVDAADIAQLVAGGRNASLASAAAEAAATEEGAYVDACAAALNAVERSATSPATASGRRWPPPPPSEDSRVALGKQTSALAARLQQMFSRVRELERARAIGRHDLHAAQTRAGRRAGRSQPGAMDATPSGSYEVRLVRDDDARGAHARAMRRTLAANVAANDAIGLSDTFWAWMESVLALEEREELEGGDAVGGGEVGVGDGGVTRGRGGSGADPGAPSLARALRDVQANVKTVADALRERRRDIERAAKAWDAEKARVTAEAGTAAGMAAAERRRSGSPGGGERERDGGGSSADAVKRAATRASEELNARAAKAASRLPGLAQIKDAVAAADAERATQLAAADGSDERGVLGGGGTRVASEEFPPGVAERLVARGASFDGAFFDGASRSRRQRRPNSQVAGHEAAKDALERLLPVLEDSERALETVRSRSRGILKDAVDRRFGRDRLVSTHGWE